MKTFKDWANQEIYYTLKKEYLNEDSTDIGWRCYAKDSLDQEWHPMGWDVTKEKAIANAVYEWNWSDTVGRG
jgi:hypothetical protein